jgi:putative inorganic carbon (HCO3(-)) transporter
VPFLGSLRPVAIGQTVLYSGTPLRQLCIEMPSIPRKMQLVYCVVAAYVAGLALLCAHELVSGSSLGLAACIVAALAPPALYAAIRVPLVFPFCAYIVVMPFDTLGRLGGFGTLTKLVGLLCAAALIFRLLRGRDAVPMPRAVVAWLGLLGWMLLSTLWALEPADSLPLLAQYASLLGLYAVVSMMPATEFEMNAILGSTLLASVAASAYATWMFPHGEDVLSSSRVIIRNGDFYIDPNNFATALVLPFAIAVTWLIGAPSRVVRAAMIPALLVLAAGVAASGSRGGALAVLAMFFWLVLRSRRRLAAAGLLVLTLGATLGANPGLIARFAEAQSTDAAGRTDIWRVGLLALRDHWTIGAGIGNFANAFDREYLNVFARYVLGWHWAAHNTFLEAGVELGIVGVALLLVALFYQVLMLRIVGRDNPLFDVRVALEGALIGLLIASFSGTILNQKFTWLCFAAAAIVRARVIVARRVAPSLTAVVTARAA